MTTAKATTTASPSTESRLNRRFHKWIADNTPPGQDITGELWFYGLGLAIALFWSWIFFARLSNACGMLYDVTPAGRKLIPGTVMVPFVSLLENVYTAFVVLVPAFLTMIGHHAAAFVRESRSIYTMRRLPHKTEWLRRCVALPLLAIVCALMLALVQHLLFFGFYLLVTPKGHLPPIHWRSLWSLI